jgi:hypothetical protein
MCVFRSTSLICTFFLYLSLCISLLYPFSVSDHFTVDFSCIFPAEWCVATPQSMPALQPASPAVASPAVASPSVRAVVVPSSTSATRIPVPASPAVVHDSKAVDLVHCIVCFCAVYIPF